ncbi:elongation factor tu GTP binding domain-containing protein [Cyclospora cayetanensis]|uniref:Elongation factor tu GTP binding domain-containing protein n=1 Tax=Cyclospora cayetanensis TaxID=88456 RepID=A0A1D3CSL6_9EIME|nr:elongation factor tu GTP binding domain-containing protein [Cyclospora cayetanensis]
MNRPPEGISSSGNLNESPEAPHEAPSAPVSRQTSITCCSKEGVCVSVGVLGHVDSGKTSLCRALSQVISTCGLDKHPQSKERGITLDLGFSAFQLALPHVPPCCKASPAHTPGTHVNAAGSSHAACAAVTAAPLPSDGSSPAQAAREAARASHAAAEIQLPADACAREEALQVQICLVDCPGHASLVRTVIGGAHIIDLALLIVDATKGLQTQTAECIVICEAIRKPLLVVLNKIDLIPKASRQQKARLASCPFLLRLKPWQQRCDVCSPTSAAEAAGERLRGIVELKEALAALLLDPRYAVQQQGSTQGSAGTPFEGVKSCLFLDALNRQRCLRCTCCREGGFGEQKTPPLLFCSDHAFPVRGKGTVVTGTVLRGGLKIGDTLTMLSAATAGVVAMAAKVKGIQRFHKEASEARTGQRAAVCLAGVDASHVERGLLAAPGGVPPIFKACIASVRLIRIFHLPVQSGQRFHCTFGHLTAIATVHFFSRISAAAAQGVASPAGAPSWREEKSKPPNSLQGSHSAPMPAFDSAQVYEETKGLSQETPTAFALLTLDRPVLALMGSVLLASRLDVEASLSTCRLAFEGHILRFIQEPTQLPPRSVPFSAGGASQQSGRGAAQSKTQTLKARDSGTAQAASAIVSAEAAAAEVPLPMEALRVVRRKLRLGVVERFGCQGASACMCGGGRNSASASHEAARRPGTCQFLSTSMVVRGLFKDAQHVRRFAGFKVALVEAHAEDAERRLRSGPGDALYDACLSLCLPALACPSPSELKLDSGGVTDTSIFPESSEGTSTHGDSEAGNTPSSCRSPHAGAGVLVRAARVGAAFGSKGKCHVELLQSLSCAEVGAQGGLGGGGTQFCALDTATYSLGKQQRLEAPVEALLLSAQS